MANTEFQRQVEAEIVSDVLPPMYGEKFEKARVALTWRGVFEFDAVSADRRTVMCISTSCCVTARGRPAIAKFQKIKADALYLLHAVGVERRVLVFTDPAMLAHFEKERNRGRFPPEREIELQVVPLPTDLARALKEATAAASQEIAISGRQP
jgi:hypothetical protein